MKVVKTTFEGEQKEKDEAFLRLSPIERMDGMRKIRELMKKKGVRYSYKGLQVTVRKSL
ncbi:MAG: hypothetical protein ACKO96_07925 [Flammeovirgaceae bacterium]